MNTVKLARGADRGASRTARGAAAAGTALLCSLALVACGGGGGGDGGAQATPSEGSQSSGQDGSGGSGQSGGSGIVAIAPLVEGAASFHFKVDASLSSEAALDAAVGGTLFTGWNPSNVQTLLRPGMKVLFFGKAAGCDGAQDQGPVVRGADAAYASSASLAGLADAGAQDLRWVPSADTSACDASERAASGASMVQLEPSANGALGLYTSAAPLTADNFFGAFDAAGQDGKGTNAFISGSYVAFRQDWNSASAIAPWAAGRPARVVSTQSVGAASVEAASAVGGTMQAKQEITVTFINPSCASGGISAQRPCQLEYLFNTAIFRTGVSDWSGVSWFNNGAVWFDAGQGGMPVVDGPVVAKGGVVADGSSGLPIYSSEGAPTQHAAFAAQNFDLRISFEQLQNVLRLVVSRQLGKPVAQLVDADMAATWGARWNDAAAWVLLSSEVGQEVYNPLGDRAAAMGGSFSQLYVGPQAD
jgi:hypothetical protein